MDTQGVLRIDRQDNLAVALRDLESGAEVSIGAQRLVLKKAIPAKHKFTLCDLEAGDTAIMYGIIVGVTTRNLAKGTLITTENLHHATGACTGKPGSIQWQPPRAFRHEESQFLGIRRSNGLTGTANYWLMVPMVFCSNRELELLKETLPRALGYASQQQQHYQVVVNHLVNQLRSGTSPERLTCPAPPAIGDSPPVTGRLFPNIDGIKFLIHHSGCGGTRNDARSLCGLLAGYITHPNVGGASVISLGCQNAEVRILKEEIARRMPQADKPILYFDRQSWTGPQDMLSTVIQQTLAGMAGADQVKRETVPVSQLVVGVECGGSDGFSGISANPVIGRTVDAIVGSGGSAILSEFPELCGVESELVARCQSQQSADRFLALMQAYQQRAKLVGASFDMNPSPGNIRDGLITDAMKSAGAAKKGGTSPIVDVVDYPERVNRKGLTLLCTPGNDVESTTALAGAGANLILFSTGLGTPTGNPIVPVIKVASNSDVSQRLATMIDFDTGPVIQGTQSITALAEQLHALCLDTASGRSITKAEQNGQEDFIPWKRDVSL